MIVLGNNILKHGLALAPMAGVADRSYRAVCREYGAEYTVSEMISAKAVHYKDKKTDALAQLDCGDHPSAIQLFGSEPDIMAEAAEDIERRFAPDVIDINMGCPVPKITGNGEGSALSKNIPLACGIVRAIKSAVSVPVSVKIRSGWDSEHKNAPRLAAALEEAGADMIVIHGRTKTQMYAPPVDFEIIREVCSALTVPCIANGGIYDAADALEMFERTGCGGIMIGRGSYGNPFIFREISCMLEGKPCLKPERGEIIDTAQRHMAMLIADKGYTGVLEARRHMAWYIRGFDGAASLRGRINTAASKDEIFELLEGLRAGAER